MSHFIREFEAILAEKNLRSGSKVFQIAGLDKSMLSRIRAGGQIQFSEIPRVAAAVDAEEMTFLRLLRARLLEECTDPRADRISIEIAGHKSSADAMQSALRDLPVLPHKIESALRSLISNIPKDAGLRKTILWLGNEVFSSAKETAAARSIVDVAAAQSLGATNAPLSSAKPVNYKFARKSSKQKHSEHA